MPTKTTVLQFLRYHLPVLLYAGLILSVSSIPNLPAPKLGLLRADSIMHFCEYACFAFLLFRSISHISQRLRLFASAGISLVILGLFSLADEYLQSFIPGRTSDFYDVLADLAGGSAIILLVLFLRSRKVKPDKTLSSGFPPQR